MRNRIIALDLARGFTVLMMPAVHTGMLYSHPSVHESALGYFLIAIAEGPGAPLFMLLMGISFTFTKIHSHATIVKRALVMLAGGYALNVFKFIIPYNLELLPVEMLHELEIGNNAIWELLGMGDIFHFAAIASILLHVIYRQKHYSFWAVLGAICIALVSPFVWDIQIDLPVLDHLFGLLSGHPPQTFFPLFPWLTYPLLGLYIRYKLQRDPNQTFKMCGILGTILVLGGLALANYFKVNNPYGFYRTHFPETMWHVGIVLLCIYSWHILTPWIKNTWLAKLLVYSSKNITLLYCIQWVMICWLLPVMGWRQLDLFTSIIVMIVMTVNTYLTCYTFQLIKQHYGRQTDI